MGNHHSASQHSPRPRKNVHWKSAGRPAPPGRPEVAPPAPGDEPHAVTLRWAAGAHDGGAPLRGYRVECNRVGSAEWVRTAPPVVQRPELLLSGLQPPHRYRFRVAALNAVGASDYSELSDAVSVPGEPAPPRAPRFLRRLEDHTALENDKTEFRVTFEGSPPPAVAWFKDDYEIFSSRRTAISTDDGSSVLVFHQTLASDEGEIRCTATNRSGHAVTRARLAIEAPPKLRYPRQYEDGLLYEVNETIFLKVTVVGSPPPVVEWRHDGAPLAPGDRVEIAHTPKFSTLKIHASRRGDRGEYQAYARNSIGEDSAAFLVTVTAPPEPPRRVAVARQVDRSVTLTWQPPADDGGCRVGNYVVEYYRAGWNVWLKATTSRQTGATLFDLIEGSEYRFRVKAESPYGMSAPSEPSAAVRIPGRAADMDFLAVEARIIETSLATQDGEERASPAPRRKRSAPPALPAVLPPAAPAEPPAQPPVAATPATEQRNDEFMLVLYPESNDSPAKTEKREWFQLESEWASPPPLSLSAPELSPRCGEPVPGLRHSVSSTELLHEHAMARFYKALAMRNDRDERAARDKERQNNRDIPHTDGIEREPPRELPEIREPTPPSGPAAPEPRWQHSSFEDDYTASTVSTDGEYSDDASLDGEQRAPSRDEDTYNPRKTPRRARSQEPSPSPPRDPPLPLPLPDPNFVPKPILKKREVPDVQPLQPPPPAETQRPNGKQILNDKPKKDTLLKKITKMPKQKPFQFPKLLGKKEPERNRDDDSPPKTDLKVAKKPAEPDKITDEGRTIIDYYGSIVKEYSSRKPAAPLYLNTEDLKTVAEKQRAERKTEAGKTKRVAKTKKSPESPEAKKPAGAKSNAVKTNNVNSTRKTQAGAKAAKQNNAAGAEKERSAEELSPESGAPQQVVLRTTERATVVIPIDYGELEKRAKRKVRGALQCALDACLLALAFWAYLRHHELLALPFLLLLAYRHLAAAARAAPPALRRLLPAALLKKTS